MFFILSIKTILKQNSNLIQTQNLGINNLWFYHASLVGSIFLIQTVWSQILIHYVTVNNFWTVKWKTKTKKQNTHTQTKKAKNRKTHHKIVMKIEGYNTWKAFCTVPDKLISTHLMIVLLFHKRKSHLGKTWTTISPLGTIYLLFLCEMEKAGSEGEEKI